MNPADVPPGVRFEHHHVAPLTSAIAPFVVLALVTLGCQQDSSESAEKRGQWLEVGEHRIVLELPEAWEHLDYGRAQHFRKDTALLALEDLGPLDAPLPEVAQQTLEQLGHNERRDVRYVHRDSVASRDAISIETWDRLTHLGPQRFVFIDDGGKLLLLYTKSGSFETTQPAFERVKESLRYQADGPPPANLPRR